jgi:LytS/YehU family sensor histidine kinase
MSLVAVVVYGSTILLFPLLEKKRRVLLFFAGSLVHVVLYTLLRSAYDKYLWGTIQQMEERNNIRMYLVGNALAAIWFFLISGMLYISQKWYEQKQHVRNIQIAELQNELKYLRAQMNPHFLFNGLNTIYGHIDSTNEKARQTLLQFSQLLRYNLYEADTELIELGKELHYIDNYIGLQKERSNELNVKTNINVVDPSVKIAPLLFIPFIENAFKHVSREEKHNYIDIQLVQKANCIEFLCSNSKEKKSEAAAGIGLLNIKRRLDLLYPGKHQLKIDDNDAFYEVNLALLYE